jgi:hypothetical protein
MDTQLPFSADLPVVQRVTAKGVSPEEVCDEADRLVSAHKLRLVSNFRTFETSGGRKLVCACEDAFGRAVILRVGERRPSWFFPDGYEGQYIRVPRRHDAGDGPVPFEIEELVEGSMVANIERAEFRKGKFSHGMLAKLLAAFWEFQRVVAPMPLEQLYAADKLSAHLKDAEPQITDALWSRVHRALEANASFWKGGFPSKWKFAADNLLIDARGKVALIDNVAVGARYFAYDLGWLVWPRWVGMDTEYFSEVFDHHAYLASIRRAYASPRFTEGVRLPEEDAGHAFTLMLLERVIGSLSDVERQTRHLADAKMAGDAGAGRRGAHAQFLRELLDLVLRDLGK